jgi:hypothetical protein
MYFCAGASATIWLRLMASANSVVVNVLVQEPISTRVSRVNGARASVAFPYGKK